jgi:hypothetical protein
MISVDFCASFGTMATIKGLFSTQRENRSGRGGNKQGNAARLRWVSWAKVAHRMAFLRHPNSRFGATSGAGASFGRICDERGAEALHLGGVCPREVRREQGPRVSHAVYELEGDAMGHERRQGNTHAPDD